MTSSNKLKDLYESDLKPQLEGMEKDRKEVKKWRNLAITALVLAFLSYQLAQNNYYLILVGLFIIAAIYLGIRFKAANSSYKEKFKSQIVQKIVAFINPDYTYNPRGYVPATEYHSSGIFPPQADRYRGDDLVKGVIEKTPFSFSEIKSEEKRETTDDDGHKKTEWRTIFKGLFFVAEFNKHLTERTFVVPEKAHTNLLGKEKKGVSRYGKLVKLENPEFEKIFSVYGSSQQEARYILTPVMMEAMSHVQQTYKLKMSFSFVGDKVYCAIPFSRDMFEPRIGKGVDYRDIEEMYMLFSLIETIVKEMNLNTRIWTKA